MIINSSNSTMTSTYYFRSGTNITETTVEQKKGSVEKDTLVQKTGSNATSRRSQIIQGPNEYNSQTVDNILTKKQQEKLEEQGLFDDDVPEKQKEQKHTTTQNTTQDRLQTNGFDSMDESIKSKQELEYEAIKKILEMLRGVKEGKIRPIDIGRMMDLDLDVTKQAFEITLQDEIPMDNKWKPSIWTRTTIHTTTYCENEKTTFKTQGTVITKDGRELSFSIDLSMTREFAASIDTFSSADYIVYDPLVINLDSNCASISDQKFYFDIDCDGTKESLSYANNGSGFLALDKNNDGIINDGSELFGTKSGNGFHDLAKYDADGNGWIDEADSVFQNLKIWTRDDFGNSKLITLKEAGVGAICLESKSTKFALNNSENVTNGYVRRTGYYLAESGEAKTIQHIDLTV